MLDFLKILILNLSYIEAIFDNPLLKNHKVVHRAEYNEFNQASYVKEYRGIYFCFYIKEGVFTKLEILIKPHYYFNNGKHNSNDFSVINCIKILLEIKNTLKIPIKEARIINIEFGINCISPIDVKKLLNQLYYHGKNLFYNTTDLAFCKESYKPTPTGVANKYKLIKLYAKFFKPLGYCSNKNTLRIEIKSKRTEYIKTLGILTYADLLNPNTYLILSNTLKDEVEAFLIMDYYNELKNLNPKEKEKALKYANPLVWGEKLNMSQNVFNDNKKKYLKLLDKTGENIHIQLKNVIIEKLNFLLKGVPI